MRRFGWLVLAGAAIACGSGSGGGSSGPAMIDGVQVMAGFDPGVPAPAPSDGFQVILPIISNIQPGASDEWCTWTSFTMPEATRVNAGYGYQTESGHHVILYYTMEPKPAGTNRICTDTDMATIRYSMIGGTQGGIKDQLPGNLAVTIPKGAQIVVNHHYVNATANVMPQAQSAMTVYYDKNASYTPAGSFVVLNTSMSVPSGSHSIDIVGTMEHDFNAWTFLPHAHQYATHVTIDHVSGGKTDRLFDTDWNAAYMFHPPITTYDPSKAYAFHKGDQVHVHCDYDNTTSGNLTFGPEMCLFYAATVDPNLYGNLATDDGVWGPY